LNENALVFLLSMDRDAYIAQKGMVACRDFKKVNKISDLICTEPQLGEDESEDFFQLRRLVLQEMSILEKGYSVKNDFIIFLNSLKTKKKAN
jgi:hypothetical protein